VRELSELLAAVDPEGERQEVEFTARMMQQRRDAGQSAASSEPGAPQD